MIRIYLPLMNVKLNCDLGEGFDDSDRNIMPWIDMANIACGGHAGDDETMRRTLLLALENQCSIGAHPGYPDRDGFGRNSLDLSLPDLQWSVSNQIDSFLQVIQLTGGALAYVKPHGALYNDMMRNEVLFAALLEVVASKTARPVMVVQSISDHEHYDELAATYGVNLLKEAFVDRAYTEDCQLVDRALQGAVLNEPGSIINQAKNLCEKGGVYSLTGKWIPLKADTLCVHGDNPVVVEAIRSIRVILDKNERIDD